MTRPVIDLFNEGEAISDSLHTLEGLEEALATILDPVLATTPDRGQSALAILGAMRHFRAEASLHAARITHAGFTS